jgi:hypothetical protein
MSFEPPEGILDIGNATLRVGKLEVAETSGLNQGLLNIVKNNLLITENTEYSINHHWGIKLPTTWVADFDVKGHSGKYVEFNFYNEDKTSNTSGYNLTFMDTSLTLRYDGGDPLGGGVVTIPTIVNTYRKVNIFFERNVIAVSIDGTRYLYDKRPSVLSRVISTTGSAFVNVFIEQDASNSKFKNLRIVNGRFISDQTSNIAFIGGNLGVGVNSPTESLDVLGNIKASGNVHVTGNVHAGGEIELYSNLNIQQVSNTATIKATSNVVTEFPRSKKLIKYPRVALTANSSGGYVASANSEYSDPGDNYNAFRVFNNWPYGKGYVAGAGWEPANTSTFNDSGLWAGSTSSSANTTITTDNGTTIYGEWLQLQLPTNTRIRLDHVRFSPIGIYGGTYDALGGHRSPRAGYILGSNNGTNWTILKNWSGITYNTWVVFEHSYYKFNIENVPDYYQYFRFVWTETAGSSSFSRYASCQELEFYGTPEYDPDAHGTDVTVKSVTNVPNTDWLEVYYDAKGLTNGSTTVNDLKPVGTANNGTVGGNTSVTDEAFTFDGTGDYITSTVTTGTGNQSFSVACWFNFTTLGGLLWGFTGTTDGTDNSPSNNSTPHAYFNTTGSINFDFWASATVTAENLIEPNRWYAGVWTYDGNARKIYIDGTQVNVPQISTPLSIIDNTSRLSIGIYPTNLSGGPMTGSVANFRLFNRALSSNEIYQLYAYQKEDFGHSTNNMTLKNGRLGIGTSEPQAALDVKGNILGGCPVCFHARYTAGSLVASTSGMVIPWNQVEFNRGGGFNSTNGRFTAPISGIYMFIYYARGDGTANNFQIRPQYDATFPGSSVNNAVGNVKGVGFGNEDGAHTSSYLILEMNKGQTLDIRLYTLSGSMYISTYYNGFYGYYLSSL